MKYRFLWAIALSSITMMQLNAQSCYWQQAIDYDMKINVDAKKNQYKGEQHIRYTNNSPDTLNNVYFHLYFNAFQPGSMMDTRSLTIKDPDRRVGDRISKLSEAEIGYQKVKEVMVNGKAQRIHTEGTILEVDLSKAILPGETVEIDMKWDAQVPLQVRRSGRDNKEGVRLSMAQWYPKMVEYDKLGWNANPYVGREFHGVWGNYKVEIEIDKDYIVGGTGRLANADEIGYGYTPTAVDIRKKRKLKWQFEAEQVHDFVWAADPDYVHTTSMTDAGVLLHYFYQPGEKTTENWTTLPKIMNAALTFMNDRYGIYPYDSYAFIQGGDGGMEYPMATLITGERNLTSLVGVCIHEWMHSWYHCVLATNEALYPWMDEGFTSFGTSETMNHLRKLGLIPGEVSEDATRNSVRGMENFSTSGYEEPLTTHADHYTTNQAYGVGSYVKGQAFLVQLKYILGEKVFYKGLKRYYNTWKFKHPTPDDCIRVFEKTSGMELDWFKKYWVETTDYPDYAIDTLMADGKGSIIQLSKLGKMPMPQEVEVTTVDGNKRMYYIPLTMMRVDQDFGGDKRVSKLADWPWTHATYTINVDVPVDDIKEIRLDPSQQMADTNSYDNVWPRIEELIEYEEK